MRANVSEVRRDDYDYDADPGYTTVGSESASSLAPFHPRQRLLTPPSPLREDVLDPEDDFSVDDDDDDDDGGGDSRSRSDVEGRGTDQMEPQKISTPIPSLNLPTSRPTVVGGSSYSDTLIEA